MSISSLSVTRGGSETTSSWGVERGEPEEAAVCGRAIKAPAPLGNDCTTLPTVARLWTRAAAAANRALGAGAAEQVETVRGARCRQLLNTDRLKPTALQSSARRGV